MRSFDVIVLGSINIDIVMRVRQFPAAGETVVARALGRHPGGKGANQAIAAARAGAAVAMIGAVGDDADGIEMREVLERSGVDCRSVRKVPGAATGSAYILVDDEGQNQIVVSGGANLSVELPPTEQAAIYLCQLESPLDVVAAFLQSRPRGAIGILNAAPFRPGSSSLFASADIVILNETELTGYAGVAEMDLVDGQVVDLARSLLTHEDQHIVVTLGSAGSIDVTQADFTRTHAERAEVVDTTGAGDCFCGYLAASLAQGQNWARSLAIAHRAAGLAVGKAGAISAIPTVTELLSGRAR